MPTLLARLRADSLYRNAAFLMLNAIVSAGLGFAFWAIGARVLPPAEIGAFSATLSGVLLVTTLSGLGLPVALLRHLALSSKPGTTLLTATLFAAASASVACLVILLLPWSLLPVLSGDAALWLVSAVVLLVITNAVSTVGDSGTIAQRATHLLLLKNSVGSVSRILIFVVVAFSHPEAALALSYLVSQLLATVVGFKLLSRHLAEPVQAWRFEPAVLVALRGFSARAYGASAIGILPSTIVPLLIVAHLGSAEVAYFAIPMMLVAFLNVIPGSVGQSLFAEVAAGASIRTVTIRASRGIYVIVVPAVTAMVILAPLLMLFFGDAYRENATTCLRLLALSVLFTSAGYIIDNILAARGDGTGYLVMNVANTVCVLAAVLVGLQVGGLTAAAVGWLTGQAVSAVAGAVALAVRARMPRSSESVVTS